MGTRRQTGVCAHVRWMRVFASKSQDCCARPALNWARVSLQDHKIGMGCSCVLRASDGCAQRVYLAPVVFFFSGLGPMPAKQAKTKTHEEKGSAGGPGPQMGAKGGAQNPKTGACPRMQNARKQPSRRGAARNPKFEEKASRRSRDPVQGAEPQYPRKMASRHPRARHARPRRHRRGIHTRLRSMCASTVSPCANIV